MSRQIIWEAQAIDQAAGFLHDDPDGIREMLDAVARLADEPRPAGSFPYGSPDRRRLRIGRYRVMYEHHCRGGVGLAPRPQPGRKLKGEGIVQTDGLELMRRAGTIAASIGCWTL